ncbi:MAG TPA: glycosyltransferase family 2 protein, partial [Tepidisphaeraceae bacterium]|nr:glycosyltransferase family 2 protein [Tepidisphaeraceae bacterium]
PALVGGPVANVLHDDVYATASQNLVSYLYEYYNRDPRQATFFTSNNFALSRILFLENGGFDTRYRRAAAEDREFCERWINSGKQMAYSADAVIEHAHHLTFTKYWRQHFHYGRGAFRFHQLRATRGQQPLRVEPMSFYWNLLAYPYKCGLASAGEITILLWISQAANALGFFWEKYNGKER